MKLISTIAALPLLLSPLPGEPVPADTPLETAIDETPTPTWDDEPAPNASSPNEPPQAPPSPPPQPQSRHSPRRGSGLVAAGGASLAIGGASLLLVALPSAIVKRWSLAQVEYLDDTRDNLEPRLTTARRADNAMEAGFWIGVSGIAIGIPLLVTGLVLRARPSDTHAHRIRIDGATLRF